MSAQTPVSKFTDCSVSLELRASTWLWRYETGLHSVLALLNFWVLWPWGWSARFLAVVLAVGLMAHLMYRASLRKGFMGRLNYVAGRWTLERGAVIETLIPKGEFLVWSWLMILHFRVDGQRRAQTLVLMPDSANPDSLRRLRVLLLSRAGRG